MRSSVSALALFLSAGLVLATSAAAQSRSPEQSPDAAAARATPAIWPRADSPDAMSDPATEAFVAELLGRMTVEEKVGQTIQADIGSIQPEDLLQYPLGSILAGGNSGPGGEERGDPQGWVDLARAFRASAAARPGAKVPLIFGIDAVHGHNNVVGATIFPHNIGLGAARNPELIGRIGEATALEVAVTGADWTFGPTLAVPRDDRWGRTYEGYSEDPEVQRAYAGPLTLGLQGVLRADGPLEPGRIAGSAKHYLADGGTEGGRDQGDFIGTEQELIDVHLGGYVQAIDAGVLSVMASFSGWNGVKHTGNASLLTDVLRGPLGFDGFVVSDWNAHGQLPGCSNESCASAFNAGIDMFMAPDSWKPLYANTLAQVRSGEISMERLDEAVRRILRAKVKTGVFREDRPVEGQLQHLGSPAHRALARQAVRESLVLLKNQGGVLPVAANARVLVAGAAADDIGQAAGGWTLSWQGTGNTNAHFPGGQSIWGGINEAMTAAGGVATLSTDGTFDQKPDVAIVVFGEMPYAEFLGDLRTLDFEPEEPLAILRRLKAAGVPTVSVFLSGRPMWVNPEINASDAFVAAWLPGSEGGGVADVLIGAANGDPRHDFSGVLSFSWPRDATGSPLNRGQPDYDPLFPYGYGLSYGRPADVSILSEDSGVVSAAGGADQYLVNGRIDAPWSLILEDAGGQTRLGSATSGDSPRGGVTVRPVDDLAQESGRRLTFSGPARALIWGPPVDLRREVNGDLALSFRYRIDAQPGTLTLGFGQSVVEMTDELTAGAGAEWRAYKVRLSCFTEPGAEAVETPFVLAATGPGMVSVSEIQLSPDVGPANCPAA